MRGLLLALFILSSVRIAAQVAVEGLCVDAQDGSPIVHALIKGTATSTLTNDDGRFRMVLAHEQDTLVIASLGYRTRRLTAAQVRASGVVQLEPTMKALPELSVTGRDETLLRLLVRAAKRLERGDRYRSKVHYTLSTRSREQPVEAIECFYNATIQGADLEALDLKNGRIAVAPEQGRSVMNLNTSKGFMLLRPTDRKSAFAATPLQYRSPKALRERFDITLTAILGKDPELHHIRFEPRIRDGSSFAGELWVDPADATIRRLVLRCDSCTVHPFLPLDPQGELRDVAIQYALEWTGHSDRWVLDHIELDYALTFRDGASDPRLAMRTGLGDRRMSTHGVLYFFDHDRPFLLPLFRYDTEQMDYRKILALPFDSAFWQHAPALLPTEQQQQDLAFFQRHGLLTGRTALDPNGRTGLFESNMAIWSPDRRITLKNALQRAPASPARGTVADIDRMHLEAQLFLNIDPTDSGYRTFSATVFDGFRSSYDLPEQPYSACFLNLFFDLCEVERRHMQAQLNGPGLSLERIRTIHQQAVRRMERTTQEFIRSTHLGADERRLKEWNERVQRELGIDNRKLFGLDPP